MPAALGLEIDQRAIQRIAGGAGRHRGLQGLPVEPRATASCMAWRALSVASGVSP